MRHGQIFSAGRTEDAAGEQDTDEGHVFDDDDLDEGTSVDPVMASDADQNGISTPRLSVPDEDSASNSDISIDGDEDKEEVIPDKSNVLFESDRPSSSLTASLSSSLFRQTIVYNEKWPTYFGLAPRAFNFVDQSSATFEKLSVVRSEDAADLRIPAAAAAAAAPTGGFEGQSIYVGSTAFFGISIGDVSLVGPSNQPHIEPVTDEIDNIRSTRVDNTGDDGSIPDGRDLVDGVSATQLCDAHEVDHPNRPDCSDYNSSTSFQTFRHDTVNVGKASSTNTDQLPVPRGPEVDTATTHDVVFGECMARVGIDSAEVSSDLSAIGGTVAMAFCEPSIGTSLVSAVITAEDGHNEQPLLIESQSRAIGEQRLLVEEPSSVAYRDQSVTSPVCQVKQQSDDGTASVSGDEEQLRDENEDEGTLIGANTVDWIDGGSAVQQVQPSDSLDSNLGEIDNVDDASRVRYDIINSDNVDDASRVRHDIINSDDVLVNGNFNEQTSENVNECLRAAPKTLKRKVSSAATQKYGDFDEAMWTTINPIEMNVVDGGDVSCVTPSCFRVVHGVEMVNCEGDVRETDSTQFTNGNSSSTTVDVNGSISDDYTSDDDRGDRKHSTTVIDDYNGDVNGPYTTGNMLYDSGFYSGTNWSNPMRSTDVDSEPLQSDASCLKAESETELDDDNDVEVRETIKYNYGIPDWERSDVSEERYPEHVSRIIMEDQPENNDIVCDVMAESDKGDAPFRQSTSDLSCSMTIAATRTVFQTSSRPVSPTTDEEMKSASKSMGLEHGGTVVNGIVDLLVSTEGADSVTGATHGIVDEASSAAHQLINGDCTSRLVGGKDIRTERTGSGEVGVTDDDVGNDDGAVCDEVDEEPTADGQTYRAADSLPSGLNATSQHDEVKVKVLLTTDVACSYIDIAAETKNPDVDDIGCRRRPTPTKELFNFGVNRRLSGTTQKSRRPTGTRVPFTSRTSSRLDSSVMTSSPTGLPLAVDLTDFLENDDLWETEKMSIFRSVKMSPGDYRGHVTSSPAETPMISTGSASAMTSRVRMTNGYKVDERWTDDLQLVQKEITDTDTVRTLTGRTVDGCDNGVVKPGKTEKDVLFDENIDLWRRLADERRNYKDELRTLQDARRRTATDLRILDIEATTLEKRLSILELQHHRCQQQLL